MHWDIFCRVIDNYGDIGICWRLSADLAARGHSVRLWVDDDRALTWMAPGALQGLWPRIQVMNWAQSQDPNILNQLPFANVWVESFGCEIPPEFIRHFAQEATGKQRPQPTWINLEYLSAEPYVERCHGLPSPIMSGPAAGWTKYFYYPGFTQRTGGLLREPDWQAEPRQNTLRRLGLNWQGERIISLFCYAPGLLPYLLDTLNDSDRPTLLLATHGKAQQAVQTWQSEVTASNLRIANLPPLTQTDFDQLLALCDLNFVRGEDSVVRAIWAGKPFVWNIYPQDDAAHTEKLAAFLTQLQLPPEIVTLHHAWNDLLPLADGQRAIDWLCTSNWQIWREKIEETRALLQRQDDLTTALLEFVNKKQ